MIRRSVINYYIFGTEMRYLQDVKQGWQLQGDSMVLENINRFLGNIEKLELNVTRRAAWKLYKLRDKFAASENKLLTAEQAKELSEIMDNVRLTLDAEIQGLEAFITTDKRFDTTKLLEDMSALFAPGVFDQFPDIAKVDFNEAGKCIAFALPTAAAFHTLRGTEANLRHYYKKMIKQKRINTEMWGPIVEDLRKRSKTKKHNVLNNHLDNIRLSFRNPTQHPEATYDIQEVQDLLSVCIDANNRMYKIIQEES
jgi:hypothetical protein